MADQLEEIPPRAFISYTWDSENHKEKVLELSNQLREYGIDCNIDQYEISPPEGWTHWAINQVEDSDYVLLVCTENFNLAARKKENPLLDKNSTWQADIVTTILFQESSKNTGGKFIPVVFEKKDLESIPLQLKEFTSYHLNEKENPKGFESLYRHILKESNKPQVKLHSKKSYTNICPYRGLSPFREEDADYFFGREKFIEKLIKEVKQKTLVSILGPSGSGKSSVVYAGLIPYLQKTENVITLKFRPGLEPIKALAYSIVDGMNKIGNKKMADAKRDKLASSYIEDLYSGKETLDNLTLQLRKTQKRPILIFIDQFEEIITISNEKDRKLFLSSILALAQKLHIENDDTCNILITMRIDFLGKVLSYPESAELFSDNSSSEAYIKKLIIGPMNAEEVTACIEKPALETGLNLEKGLSELIILSLGQETGNLPLLEFCLLELWKKQESANRGIMTISDYNEIGGVHGALVKHADEVYKQQNDLNKEQIRKIFIQLVQPGEETGDTRKIATIDDIGEENLDILRKLADERLVVINRTSEGSTTVEVIHEALIREWGLLKVWMDADRNFRLWQESIKRIQKMYIEEKVSGNLLKGNKLLEAEEWLSKKSDEIGQEQKEYIERSIETRNRKNWEREEKQKRKLESEQIESEKKRKVQLRITIGSLVGVALAVSLSIFSFIELRHARAHEAEAFNWIAHSSYNNPSEYFKGFYTAFKAGVKASSLNDTYEEVQLAKLTLLEYIHQIQKPDLYTKQVKESDKLVFTKEIANLNNSSPVWNIAYSPDEKFLAAASYNSTIKIWLKNDTGEYNEIKSLTGHKGYVRSVHFSTEGKLLASGSEDKTIKIWNVDDFLKKDTEVLPVATLTGHYGEITSVIFRPAVNNVTPLNTQNSDTILISGSYDRTIKVWNIGANNEYKEIKTLYGHRNGINTLSFCSDGNTFASGSDDRTIKLWTIDEKNEFKESKSLTGHSFEVTSVSFSKDCKVLASGSWDKTIKLWNLNDYKEIKTFKGHSDTIRSLIITPDSKMIISGSRDNTIKFWNISGPQDEFDELKTITGHSSGIYSLAISADGKTLTTGSFDSAIKIWKIGEYKEIKKLATHSNTVSTIAFSPDGKYLATGSDDRTIRIWNILEYKEIKTLVGHTKGITSLTYSPDGKYLFSGSNDSSIKIWDLSNESPIAKSYLLVSLKGHTNAITSLSLTADGKILASGSADNTIKIWRLDIDNKTKEITKKSYEKMYESQTLRGHTGSVLSLNFNKDGKSLVSGSEDTTIKIWVLGENADFKENKTLAGHIESVTSVQFSPDGKMLASGSGKKTFSITSGENIIKIWKSENENDFKEIRTLIGHTDSITNLHFSPSSAILASSSKDKIVKIWSVDDFKLIKDITGQSEIVTTVRFSPDGNLIATGSVDHTVQIINNDLNQLLAISCKNLQPYFNQKNSENKYGYEYDQDDKKTCDKIMSKSKEFFTQEELYEYYSAIYKSDYDKAISLMPKNPIAYIYRFVEKYNKDDFEKALSLNKDKQFELYLERGYAFERKGNLNKAIDSYKKSLEINSNFKEAKIALEALEKK